MTHMLRVQHPYQHLYCLYVKYMTVHTGSIHKDKNIAVVFFARLHHNYNVYRFEH